MSARTERIKAALQLVIFYVSIPIGAAAATTDTWVVDQGYVTSVALLDLCLTVGTGMVYLALVYEDSSSVRTYQLFNWMNHALLLTCDVYLAIAATLCPLFWYLAVIHGLAVLVHWMCEGCTWCFVRWQRRPAPEEGAYTQVDSHV